MEPVTLGTRDPLHGGRREERVGGRLASLKKVSVVPVSGQKGPVEAKPPTPPQRTGPPASQGVAPCKRGRGGASAGLSPPPSSFHKSPLQRRRRSREVYGAGAQRGGTRHLPFPRRFLSFLFSHLGLLNLSLLAGRPPRPRRRACTWWRRRRLRAAPGLREAKAAPLRRCSQPPGLRAPRSRSRCRRAMVAARAPALQPGAP